MGQHQQRRFRQVAADQVVPGSQSSSQLLGLLLTVKAAAERLGITPATFYDWLGQSDHGQLVIRGQNVAICYFQGGPKGQGRIQIEATEVERILQLMRVQPMQSSPRRPPISRALPGIKVRLGLPSR